MFVFFYFFQVGYQLDQVYQVRTSPLIFITHIFLMDLKTFLSAAHKKLRLSDQNLPQENTKEMVEDVGVLMLPIEGAQVPEQGAWSVGG